MIAYRLPPAGDRVAWSRGVDEAAVRGLFTPWEAAYFGSGTVALAALLTTLRARHPKRNEVVVAAYNCPGIISAIEFAGCEPRLVDLAPMRPWMDLEEASRALSFNTLAIIGVDLFGIPERHGALRELAAKVGATHLQDSAQGFPRRAGDATWQADTVIVSFGRGKPVSLLAGGAVLCRDRALARELNELVAAPLTVSESRHWREVALYNGLRHPRLYWIPAAIPALHLGETRYQPLAQLTAMPSWLKRRVPEAVAAYRAERPLVESRYAVMELRGGLIDLARSCGLSSSFHVSRYPLLAPNWSARERICRALENHGASRFYGAPLPEVDGLETRFSSRARFPRAREFAKRLFTLPTHDGVRAADLATISRVLGQGNARTATAVRETIG